MCLRRLNSPRLSVLIPSKTSAVPPEVDPNSPKQVKTNSSRLTEELHERFSITTVDGTSAMFIFHALVLSLTRPNFFSRAIIEPRVQTPLPAPPDSDISGNQEKPGGSGELVSPANPSSPAIVTSRQEKRANVETFRKWRRCLWRNSMSSSCFPCSFQLQMVLCLNTNKQS